MSGGLREREMLRELGITWGVFPQLFEFSLTFTSVSTLYNMIETHRTCFLFLLENSMMKKEKQVDYWYFDH